MIRACYCIVFFTYKPYLIVSSYKTSALQMPSQHNSFLICFMILKTYFPIGFLCLQVCLLNLDLFFYCVSSSLPQHTKKPDNTAAAVSPSPVLATSLPLLQGALRAQDVRTARLPGGQAGQAGVDKRLKRFKTFRRSKKFSSLRKLDGVGPVANRPWAD